MQHQRRDESASRSSRGSTSNHRQRSRSNDRDSYHRQREDDRRPLRRDDRDRSPRDRYDDRPPPERQFHSDRFDRNERPQFEAISFIDHDRGGGPPQRFHRGGHPRGRGQPQWQHRGSSHSREAFEGQSNPFGDSQTSYPPMQQQEDYSPQGSGYSDQFFDSQPQHSYPQQDGRRGGRGRPDFADRPMRPGRGFGGGGRMRSSNGGRGRGYSFRPADGFPESSSNFQNNFIRGELGQSYPQDSYDVNPSQPETISNFPLNSHGGPLLASRATGPFRNHMELGRMPRSESNASNFMGSSSVSSVASFSSAEHRSSTHQESQEPVDVPCSDSSENVVLDTYNSDLELIINPDLCSAKARSHGGFAYIWAGVRATHGVKAGKACFEVSIDGNADCSHLDASETTPHVIRVGWSLNDSSLQLGEEPLSFGFGGTGKISTRKNFISYGKPFGVGDVIGCCLDLTQNPITISYTINGCNYGVAFHVPKSELQDRPLFPHIFTKNQHFTVNFGQMPEPMKPLFPGFTPIGRLSECNLVRGSRAPSAKSECQVLMMVGLPGSGKTTWAEFWRKKHSDKKFNILGTNTYIDRMKVMNLTRWKNYHDRWDMLIQKCTECFDEILKTACHHRRNYILDQTNVFPTARVRKLKDFDGFEVKAVVVVPPNDEYLRRSAIRADMEGKAVPEDAILNMKANFVLPDIEESATFSEVLYTDLPPEEAAMIVSQYNAEAISRGQVMTNGVKAFIRRNELQRASIGLTHPVGTIVERPSLPIIQPSLPPAQNQNDDQSWPSQSNHQPEQSFSRGGGDFNENNYSDYPPEASLPPSDLRGRWPRGGRPFSHRGSRGQFVRPGFPPQHDQYQPPMAGQGQMGGPTGPRPPRFEMQQQMGGPPGLRPPHFDMQRGSFRGRFRSDGPPRGFHPRGGFQPRGGFPDSRGRGRFGPPQDWRPEETPFSSASGGPSSKRGPSPSYQEDAFSDHRSKVTKFGQNFSNSEFSSQHQQQQPPQPSPSSATRRPPESDEGAPGASTSTEPDYNAIMQHIQFYQREMSKFQ